MDDFMKSFVPDKTTDDTGYMKSFRPDPVRPDPQLIAHAASDSEPQAATKALDISKQTGFAPSYAEANLDELSKARDKQKFAADLDGNPVLQAYAGQSPQHAAAVRPDAGILGKLEGWLTDFKAWGRETNRAQREAIKVGFLDIGHAEAMREYMGSGGPLADTALDSEAYLKEYDSQEHSVSEGIIRAAPQMALYGAVGVLTGSVGVGALLYAQNKGVLARQIQQAQPLAPEGKDEDLRLTDDQIDNYATAGSAAVAVTLTGLLNPLLKSLPGAKELLQKVGAGVLARGAATTVGQAAIRSLSAYGLHTLMGAEGMALQHTINSATVQKATTGEMDVGQLAREHAETFLKVLPVAAAFASYGPTKDFLADRGRLNAAPLERARLDSMIELSRQAQLSKTAPERAAELFGMMGRGVKVFIDYKAAKKMTGLPPDAVAAAEVTHDAVEVPVGDYLAHLADQHESVKDDVKLTADGYTMNEAKARDKELRNALPPDVAEVLLGKKTPEEVHQFEQPAAEEKAPPAKAAEGAETVKLYRGTVGRDPSVPGRAGARFMTPDRVLAESYASPENTMNAGVSGEGKVSEETLHFQNVLKVESLDALKEKLGFEPGKPVGTEEVLNAARKAGHDAVSYKTKELGTVYVDLMNWLHELVKQYGGTVEKWQEKLTPEFVAALKEEASKGAIAPEEHAARAIEAMSVGDIDPARFERLAKQSDKYIQEAAEKARTGSVAGAKKSSPADVAVLQTHELARDLNRAKAAKASEVKAELDKSLALMSKQSENPKLRASIALAGRPLLNLFDALTGGVGASKSSPADLDLRAAMPEAAEWFKENARPFTFSEKFIDKFLTNPRSWNELRPFEARIVADVVKQITTAAREERIIRGKDAEATVEEVSGEIRGELRQNPSKGLPLPSGVPSTWARDRMLDANAANAVQLRPKNNLRQKSTAAAKWIFDRINEAVYARDDLFREIGKAWDAAFKTMPKEVAARRFETYDLSAKLPTPGMEPLTAVPRQYLWKLARHRMSQGNMDVVLSTSGWDKAAVDHILFDDPKTKLTVPEWDYLQGLADINENGIWPRVKAHFEKYYGQAPPKTAAVPFKVQLEDGSWKEYRGGYEPLKRDARPGVAPQAEPTKGIAQYWGRDFNPAWTPSSGKARVDNAHYLVNMDWDSSRSSIATTLHWLAFDQPVRDVAKLLNDQGLAADMNQYMGQGRADMTRGWLKSSATRQAQSIPEGMEIVSRAFGWQRKLALMRIVGASGRLALAQLSHPIGLMSGGQINPVHGIPALLSIFKPMEMANGEVRLFPNWNDAITYGKEVAHRADNAFGTLRGGWDQAGPTSGGPIGTLKTVAQKTAGLYLHAVDRLTTTWAWTAAHNEAVSRFKMEPFSDEACAYANGKTQDVMPVHDIETAAPVLTNRQIGGFLIMHGFKNTLYNMRQDALAASVKDFHLAETPGQYGSAVAKTAGRVALQAAMFGGFAVMGKLALGYGQQPDETKGEWIARDMLAGQTVDVPFIGGLGEPLAKLAVGGNVSRRDFTPYGNPGISATLKLQEMLGDLVNNGREDYKKVLDVAEAVAFYLGVPSHPPRVGAEHLYEMLMGEGYDTPDQSDAAGRFFYTDKQWESIKRSLTPDED